MGVMIDKLTNSITTRLEQGYYLESGRQIDRVAHTKVLGLMFDKNLTWSFHIDSISRKIAKSIGIFYRARHYLSCDILKILVTVLSTHIFHIVLSSGAVTINRNSFLSISYRKEHYGRLHFHTTGLQVGKPLLQRLDILNIFEIVKLRLSELACIYNTNQIT